MDQEGRRGEGSVLWVDPGLRSDMSGPAERCCCRVSRKTQQCDSRLQLYFLFCHQTEVQQDTDLPQIRDQTVY